MLLKDKVAVITGGAGLNGLGYATARQMAAHGARRLLEKGLHAQGHAVEEARLDALLARDGFASVTDAVGTGRAAWL